MSVSFTSLSDSPDAAVPALPPRALTEAEFIAWTTTQNVKAEWADGDVILMSPSNWEHTSLRRWLDGLLTDFVEERGLGVVGDDTLVRLSKRLRIRVPDIFFVAHERLFIIEPTLLREPPDLIVEIVSPDSAARDWREKYLEYEDCGVREYWVIDPRAGSFEAYALDSAGKYQPISTAGGIIRSAVLPGFWVRLQWLAAAQRPAKKQALAEILAG